MDSDKIDFSEMLQKYANCLEEIKCRLQVAYWIVHGEKSTGYLRTNVETVYLQFRKILELLALGSLVSNKYDYAKYYSNFMNHYHAKHIFRDLEKINPDFYPKPGKQIKDEKGEVIRLDNIETGYLTKDEFIDIYDESSSLLHAENPFATPKTFDNYTEKFTEWNNKIIVLLSHHQLQLLDRKTMIWAILKTKPNGNASVHLIKAVSE